MATQNSEMCIFRSGLLIQSLGAGGINQRSRKIGLQFAKLAVTLRDVSACILTPATTAPAGKGSLGSFSPPLTTFLHVHCTTS